MDIERKINAEFSDIEKRETVAFPTRFLSLKDNSSPFQAPSW